MVTGEGETYSNWFILLSRDMFGDFVNTPYNVTRPTTGV